MRSAIAVSQFSTRWNFDEVLSVFSFAENYENINYLNFHIFSYVCFLDFFGLK
jgi:hypothetical protein